MSHAQNRAAVCATGWHFGEAFYTAARALPNADLYVVAHKPQAEIPSTVTERVGAHRIFAEPNLGYDWGCFQQFLARGIWRQYAFTIFIHDDVTILDSGVVERCAELLARGHGVVGNGRCNTRKAWPSRYPYSYAHAAFLPPPGFVHDIVRGSFFAASRAALEALGAFEVFWDPFGLGLDYGNYSLRASCARLEAHLGPRCFTFLSETYLSSPFVQEHVRGDTLATSPAGAGQRRKLTPANLKHYGVRRLLAACTHSRWQPERPAARAAARALMPVVQALAGTRAHSASPG